MALRNIITETTAEAYMAQVLGFIRHTRPLFPVIEKELKP